MEFKGASYELAVTEATKHFSLQPEKLAIKVLEEGSSSMFSKKPWRIEALPAAEESGGQPASPDVSAPQQQTHSEITFRLSFTPEGVFLDAKTPPDADELTEYAARRGVMKPDVRGALDSIRSGRRPAYFAPPMAEPPPLNDYCVIRVTKDDMEAYMKIFPGDDAGKRLTPPDAMSVLRDQYKIVDGIDVPVLRNAVLKRVLRQEVLVAAGRLPIDGRDGSIQFHFQTEHNRRPKILEGDRVDYRTLDLFSSVQAGDTLVTRTAATKGENGATLKGKPLLAKSGKDVRMPRGKGVNIDEENLTMTSALDGMVNLLDGRVVVNSVYTVDRNVDMSTGNIDFMGDIEIRGNVISGMTVKAAGNIVVEGVVEAATLIAGGNIVLSQGMQGNDRGSVTAEGDVVAKFFERARISAKGAVTVDAVYHSDIAAAGGVTLTGKRASLIGGMTRSATFVAARVIGSPSFTSTIVEVGILPAQRQRYSQLEMTIKQLESSKDKLNLLVTSFQQADASQLTPDRIALRDTVMLNYEDTMNQIEECRAERAVIAEQMAAITGGKVHATGTVFPGTRIVIGSETYNVEQQIDYSTFRVSQGEIRFVPCEFTP